MDVSSAAGRLPDESALVDVDALAAAYHDRRPDARDPAQRVSFGTSGHRGSSLGASFNEAHVVAMAEAVRRYRSTQGVDGPLFLGRDPHALSGPAFRTAVEVLVGGGVDVTVDVRDGFTPTPVVSHAILSHNRGRTRGPADGIVVTPSHNPPADGGFKYNPPHGGPAGTEATDWIEQEANRLLADGLEGIDRRPYREAVTAARRHDYLAAYVEDLPAVVDLEAVRTAGLTLGVDPLGGASVDLWPAIAERHGLDLEVVNDAVDPTFSFLRCDRDGKLRMDCSSPYAMAGLVEMAQRFDLGFGNDADADRHGIVTPAAGLLNPNHYLAVAVSYLFDRGRSWDARVAVGKTLVTSHMVDRVAEDLGRRVLEVPVGFKWFVDGLLDGSLGFGGEESAGASFLRRDGTVWTTDKDGVILCLLAAEATAVTGRDPGQLYRGLAERFGDPAYARVDVPASREQKAALRGLSADQVQADELAGEPIVDVLTAAPGNGAPVGGLKVVAASGWFAARPSGTEDVYKVYAESFRGEEHLGSLLGEARELVDGVLGASA